VCYIYPLSDSRLCDLLHSFCLKLRLRSGFKVPPSFCIFFSRSVSDDPCPQTRFPPHFCGPNGLAPNRLHVLPLVRVHSLKGAIPLFPVLSIFLMQMFSTCKSPLFAFNLNPRASPHFFLGQTDVEVLSSSAFLLTYALCSTPIPRFFLLATLVGCRSSFFSDFLPAPP